MWNFLLIFNTFCSKYNIFIKWNLALSGEERKTIHNDFVILLKAISICTYFQHQTLLHGKAKWIIVFPLTLISDRWSSMSICKYNISTESKKTPAQPKWNRCDYDMLQIQRNKIWSLITKPEKATTNWLDSHLINSTEQLTLFVPIGASICNRCTCTMLRIYICCCCCASSGLTSSLC